MKRIFFCLLIIASTFRLAMGTIESLDPSFDGDGYIITSYGELSSNYFKSVAIQDDGKIVALGTVPSFHSSKMIIVRYLTNGLLDTVANGGSGFGDTVGSAQVGYIYVDPLLTGYNTYAYSLALQSDGKIVTCGYLNNGTAGLFVARYTTAGVLDTSSADSNTPFNGSTGYATLTIANYDTYGYAVAIQPDGKIVVAGMVGTISNVIPAGFLFARYTTAGVLDTSSVDNTPFNGSIGYTYQILTGYNYDGRVFSQIDSIAIQSDGKIVGGGWIYDNGTSGFLVRCNNDGSLDIGFGELATGYIVTDSSIGQFLSVAIQADQKIVCAYGGFTRYLSTGYVDTDFGTNGKVTVSVPSYDGVGSGAILVQADQKIIGVGSAYKSDGVDYPSIVRLTTAGILDTTFNNTGYVITTYAGTVDSRYNSVALQIDGKIVVVGSTDQSPFSFNENRGLVARYMETNTGTIDTGYGTNGAKNLNTAPLSLPAGQAKAINVITTGAQTGKMLVADSNGTSTRIAMLDSTGTALDTNAFNTGLSSLTLSGMPQAQAIMVDSTGLIFYVLGTNGVVQSVTYGSAIVTPFDTSLVTTGYAITQQASGRILVAGKNSSNEGVVVAYTPAGVIDTSFNPSAASNASPNNVPGYWNINSTNPITAISVGSIAAQKDRIYIAYADNGSGLGNAVVQQILENGTSYAPATGTGAFTPITTGFSATVNGNTQLQMQLDVNGAIVVVAATSASTSAIKAARYNANGTTGGTYGMTAFTVIAATAGQVLENILCLSNGTILILAAVPNATAASALIKLARLTSSFALDTVNFNAGGTPPGILSSSVPASSAVMTDFYALDVIAAGGILIAGDNSPTAASANPYLAAVVNTDIVTKVSQSATALGAAGALDTTLNPAGTTAGFMNFAAELQTTNFPTATTIYAMLQKTNGSYYVAGSTSSNSYVTLMSDDDVQDATFGRITIAGTGKTNASSMLLAQDGNLLVAGAGAGTTSSGWIVSLNPSTGAVVTAFAPTATLDSHYAIVQQTSGRILVAGVISGVGKIIAYNSVTGAIDTTFGSSGYYTATGYGAINSMILDASDNIYCMVNDASNNAKVIKLVPSGAGAASGWTVPTVTAISTIAANNHLALNQAGNIVAVGVNTTTPQIVLTTITASSGTASAAFNLAVASTGITTPKVTAIMVDMNTSPGKVILAGFDDQATDIPFILRTNTAVSALDTTFNSGGANPGVQPYKTLTSGVTTNWYAGMINANGKITVAGYASVLTTPYLMRVYGDQFKAQYLPTVTAGTPGTIDTNFATAGYLSLIGNDQATSAIPQVVLPTSTPGGAQYVAFSDGTISRYTNANILDLTYNSTGHATASQPGVFSMSMLTNGGLLVAGTNPNGATNGWVEQYTTAGIPDTTFNSNGTVTLANGTIATVAVQQSLSRIVVAGQLASGNGALFALTNAGVADQTFAVGSTAGTGIYDSGIITTIYAMIADQYDRLIIAYKNGSNVAIRRLTASGELDTTFGSNGTIASAITDADQGAQVRIAIDYLGNIVVAAHTRISSVSGISIVSCDNNSGTVLYTVPNIITLTSPTLTCLIATADDKILMGGYQSGSNNMWIARVTSSGTLDTTTFNPNIFAGPVRGVMQFNVNAPFLLSGSNLTSIAIYGDGQISMVGTETTIASPTNNPFMSRAYCNPYTTQQPIDLDAKAAGTNDLTFGVSSTAASDLGVTFYATTDGTNQIARAAVVQDGNDNGLVVALDGTSITTGGANCIYLNMFDIDGLLNTSFKPSTVSDAAPGQLLVASMFDNQYVNDMLTFTVDGVSKAILAGYAINTARSAIGSLLMQVVLTPSSPGLDGSFGGLNSNATGVAFGDGKQLNTVGLQSNGRIIGAGLDQSNNGLLLGYTAAGNLDQSFGQGGTFVQGTTGIYTSAIDSLDRLVIAYRVGTTVTLARILADGSGLDATFAGTGILTTTITTALSNSNLRVAIDGLGNIVVAAVVTDTASGTCFKIARYTSAGVLSGTVNLIGTGGSAMNLTALTITKLLVDSNNAVVVVGYDDAASDKIVVARLVYSGGTYILDTTFNASSGYIKYAVHGTAIQQTVGAFIHADGRIIIAGAQV